MHTIQNLVAPAMVMTIFRDRLITACNCNVIQIWQIRGSLLKSVRCFYPITSIITVPYLNRFFYGQHTATSS